MTDYDMYRPIHHCYTDACVASFAVADCGKRTATVFIASQYRAKLTFIKYLFKYCLLVFIF